MTGGRRGQPAVQVQAVTKEFAGTPVLVEVDFDLHYGEVHALVGLNGSGKSTLMKVVYGEHQPTRGRLLIRGEERRLHHPVDALRCGIAAVPQESPVIPALSVAENVCFGRLPRRGPMVDWPAVRAKAEQVLRLLEGAALVDVTSPVGSLDLATQQLVAIARALARGADILILDEPTSSLPHEATERLQRAVRRLRDEGQAVAFISQRLDDVFSVADRVSVLRDGAIVGTWRPADIDPEELTQLMSGDTAPSGPPTATVPRQQHAPLLDVRGLSCPRGVDDLDFAVHPGEIVGLVGLAGGGGSEALRALYGLRPVTGGQVRLGERNVAGASVAGHRACGFAFISGDRRHEGIVPAQSVAFNIAFATIRRPSLRPRRRTADRAVAEPIIAQLGIRPADPTMPAGLLSGGNQQKVLVGRWLAAQPTVWLLDDPTRGVDVHARRDIHQALRASLGEDACAVFVSSEISEFLEVCDRLVVLSKGRKVAELSVADTDEAELLALATGARRTGTPAAPPARTAEEGS